MTRPGDPHGRGPTTRMSGRQGDLNDAHGGPHQHQRGRRPCQCLLHRTRHHDRHRRQACRRRLAHLPPGRAALRRPRPPRRLRAACRWQRPSAATRPLRPRPRSAGRRSRGSRRQLPPGGHSLSPPCRQPLASPPHRERPPRHRERHRRQRPQRRRQAAHRLPRHRLPARRPQACRWHQAWHRRQALRPRRQA